MPHTGLVEYTPHRNAAPPRSEFEFRSDLEARDIFHQVTLANLQPETRYRYRILVDGKPGKTLSFKTAAKQDSPFRFAAYGDNQGNPKVHRKIAAVIKSRRPDFIVHVGDQTSMGSRKQLWETEFFEPAAQLLGQVPFYVAPGNHECDSKYFYQYHSNPKPENYYTFAYGNAVFVVVDTNKKIAPGTAQGDWLIKTMESPRVQNAAWRFLVYHHPAHAAGWRPCRYDGSKKARKHLVPLAEKYEIDVVLNGHTHGYEHKSLNGVTYFVTGGGGGALDRFCKSWPHTVKTRYDHHFMLFQVEGSTMRISAHLADGIKFDELRLEKEEDRKVTPTRSLDQ